MGEGNENKNEGIAFLYICNEQCENKTVPSEVWAATKAKFALDLALVAGSASTPSVWVSSSSKWRLGAPAAPTRSQARRPLLRSLGCQPLSSGPRPRGCWRWWRRAARSRKRRGRNAVWLCGGALVAAAAAPGRKLVRARPATRSEAAAA